MDRKVLSINSVTISYIEQGSGLPLILFHGISSSSRIFSMNIESLAKHFRVIAVDLIGFGESSLDEGMDIKTYLSIFNSFIQEVGGKDVAVLGHSMGALFASSLAYHYPDSIKKLILSSCISPPYLLLPLGKTKWFSEVISRIMNDTKVQNPEQFRNSMKRIVLNPELLDESTLQILREDSEKSRGNAFSMRLLCQTKEPFLVMFSKLNCPVLFICGRHDSLIRRKSLARIANAKDFKMVTLNKSKHMMMLEEPYSYNNTIADFLMDQRQRAYHG